MDEPAERFRVIRQFLQLGDVRILLQQPTKRQSTKRQTHIHERKQRIRFVCGKEKAHKTDIHERRPEVAASDKGIELRFLTTCQAYVGNKSVSLQTEFSIERTKKKQDIRDECNKGNDRRLDGCIED